MGRVLIFLSFLGMFCACSAQTVPQRAQLTHYCSYAPCCENNPPYTAAEERYCKDECDIAENACDDAGSFAFCDDMDHDEVKRSNIVAIYSKDYSTQAYEKKVIVMTQGHRTFEARVCDKCSNDDCENCCEENLKGAPYLIDMEVNTFARSQFVAGTEITFRLK